jgi:lambda family phage tail tape measure protein
MVSKRKVQLEAGVDTTGAKKGFAEIKDSAKEMAQGVVQAGQQAAKGVESVGTGGDAAAAKLDRSTRSIIASIERATAATKAGGRGTAEYFEAVGAQKGTADTLKPYIEQLRQAERAQQLAQGSLGKMEMSGKATAAALRQVPAQFTDIITSLQGGQNPLTVFLQQGGQLKDVFGGAGAAAKALGGYVLGLVNPYTVAAAAAGVLAVGYYKGSQEGEAFRRTVILTGGAAGVTANQLGTMAANVAKLSGGTQARAAEVLDAIAQSSGIGATNIQRFADAAIRLERVGGPAAEETAKAFASLAKSPLEGALKLNESTNFLSKAVYDQIRSLEQQGRSIDASRTAQEAYFSAVNERTPALLKNLGLAERAWKAITDSIKGAGDAILSVGRGDTLDTAIAVQAREASRLRAAANNKGIAKPGELLSALTGGPSLSAQADEAERLLKQLQDGKDLQEKLALAGAANAKSLEAAVGFDKEGVQFLSRREQLEREITKARNEGNAAGKTQAEIEKRVADIREKFDPGIAAAQAGSGLAAVKRQLGQLTTAFSDAESILSAQRQAGLITESDYYDAKRGFILVDQRTQVQALQDENVYLQQAGRSNKLTTAERIANTDKIKDNLSKINEINGKAAASTAVLGIQQKSALDGVAKAYEEARQAAQDYLTTLQRGQQRELDLFGASNRTRQTAQGRDQISDRYSQERQRIGNERALTAIQRGGSLTSDQQKRFDDLLALNREFETKALASYADYTKNRLALEGDWAQGAGRAFRNYIDDAADVAKQTEQLFTNAFGGIEDALVKFVTTGKLDFKSLADSIIADLVRIAIKQQVVTALKTAATFFGFADGGAFDASGEVKRFATGGVFDQPTPFSYGGGKAGVLGEAGPEGVLPLARGAGGKLGVIAHDGGGGSALQVTYAPVIQLDGTVDRAKGLADAQQIMRQGQRELLDLLHAKGVY